jgi:hypothetical protein
MKTVRFTTLCLLMTLGALSSTACTLDAGDDPQADGPNESIGTVEQALTLPGGSWSQTCYDPRYVYESDPRRFPGHPPAWFCARCKNVFGKYSPAMSCVNLPCGRRLSDGSVTGPITNCNGYLSCGTSC